MHHIISFSLYGTDPLYCEGALQNVSLARIFYPEWTCRFYVDDTVPEDYTKRLLDMDAQVVRVERALGPMYGRFWRFWIAAEDNVARFIIRDADSRLNPRERAAVDEWILSGKSFHIMRDSYHHRRRMLGGMWGGIGGKIPGIKGLIDNWWRFDQNGGSDRFLSEVIYAMVKDDCFCHDSIKHFRDEETHDFPAHEALEGTSFVGEIVTSDHQRMDIWRRLGELDDRHLLLEEELTQRIRCLESESVVVSLRELERKVMEEISDMRRRTTEIFSKLLRMEQKEESRKRALLEIASQIKSIAIPVPAGRFNCALKPGRVVFALRRVICQCRLLDHSG